VPCALATAGLALLSFAAPLVNTDRACDIGEAPHAPPDFRISLPRGYRLEPERGTDTTLWRIWNPRGLDIQYDANDLPRGPGEPPTPPVATWDRHCYWQTPTGPLGLTKPTTETGVVCERVPLRSGHDYPAQIIAWFPDDAEFVAIIKSKRELDAMLSIVMTYTPGDYDHTLFPSGATVQRAIASGWNVRKCGPHLLEDAIYWEAVDVIRVLAKAGVDVNGVNSDDRPFLYQAEDDAGVDVVKVLFDSGARSVAMVDGKPLPPVWIAGGPATTLDLFLDHGLDANATDDRGITLLMRAAEACQTTSVKNLMARGARLESTNADGDTALIIATRQMCRDVVSELIERGARTDVADRTGRTPLMIATERVAGAEAFIAKYRDTPPPIYFGWMGVTVASTQERLPTYEAIVALLKRP
jgi:hypothetical protein